MYGRARGVNGAGRWWVRGVDGAVRGRVRGVYGFVEGRFRRSRFVAAFILGVELWRKACLRAWIVQRST